MAQSLVPPVAEAAAAGRVVRLAWDNEAAGSWILTAALPCPALPGQNAVARRWKAEPRTAVAAIGQGLRAMHEALPVRGCPFSWAAEDRLADIRHRAAAGLINPSCWDPVHQPLGISGALALLLRCTAQTPTAPGITSCSGTSAPETAPGRCRVRAVPGASGAG